MGIRNHFDIDCDGPGDRGYCRNRYAGGGSKGTVKAEARALGWSFRLTTLGWVTVCPQCQARARGETNGKGE